MGKELQDEINNLKARGRFLSLWNCATGLAQSNPPESPYTYKSGDYFIVGTVASGSGTNYRPSGSSYTTGVASTVVETQEVSVDDVYYYDGTQWRLQVNTQKTLAFVNIAGDPYDNTALASALNDKQDELVEGTGISIDSTTNTISNSGVRSVSTGATNGTISVNTNGTSAEVSVAGLGTAAFTPTTDYATAAQGALAESAVQTIGSGTQNGTIGVDGTDVAVTGLGSAAFTPSTNYATSAQGTKADSAIQGVNVDSTSLTPDANKVVTIPVAYQSTKGVVSVYDAGYGIKSMNTGQLQIHCGDWAKFNYALTNPNQWLPIVVKDLLLGMKVFLGTTITSATSNTSWNDTEKDAALNTLGAAKKCAFIDWVD